MNPPSSVPPGLTVVVTTIQAPTPSMVTLGQALERVGGDLIIVGDRKGPTDFPLPGARLISFESQAQMSFHLAGLLPANHYARKNLGYLQAISGGATCLYETDDDNAPNEHWQLRALHTSAHAVSGPGWINAYRWFTDDLIWPRGLPLSHARETPDFSAGRSASPAEIEAPIQQGLADLSPDVDAVWRLVLDREFYFERRPSLLLQPGAWCPFNSQTTWWWPQAFPLLYLPSYCSFRMTDIWRSFIAQRCLWELGCGLVFHAPEVIQERNFHNLQKDFEQEIDGYVKNVPMVAALEALGLEPGPAAVGENLLRCYRILIEGGFFPPDELPLVEAWIEDLSACSSPGL